MLQIFDSNNGKYVTRTKARYYIFLNFAYTTNVIWFLLTFSCFTLEKKFNYVQNKAVKCENTIFRLIVIKMIIPILF